MLQPYVINGVKTSVGEIPQGVLSIKAPDMWAGGIDGSGVIIAVLDSGCQPDHPDLVSQIIGGINWTNEDGGDWNRFDDYFGHGTHCAGVAVARHNQDGIVGVAPGAKILVVKVLGAGGVGIPGNIVQGYEWAIRWRGPNGERVNVVSMSLALEYELQPLRDAIIKAQAEGVLTVTASGNNGDGNANTDEKRYPGAWPEVLEVGAFNLYSYTDSYFSNSNSNVAIVAPGELVTSTYINSSYATLSGTSMATPHVAGAAALCLQQFRRDNGRDPSWQEFYNDVVSRSSNLYGDKRIEGTGLLNLLMGYRPHNP